MNPVRIAVLTLHRPWPAFILRAGKRVENRIWRTAYRGPLFLHAGRTWDYDAAELATEIPGPNGTNALDWIPQDPDEHPTGIVGLAHLIDCQTGYPSPWAIPGQWHWILDNQVYEFPEPVPCAGRQGLWAAPPDLWPALTTALESVGL